MPISTQYALPPPRSDDEFEDMVEDYCKIIYEDAQRFGRRGQSQNGIDILCTTNGHTDIGVQCKRYDSISQSDVDSILLKALTFSHPLKTLIIATTALRDVHIQSYVIDKSTDSKEIKILFWEDIRSTISVNSELLYKYYPHIIESQNEDFSIDDLKEQFNIAMREFKIIKFMRIDPTVGMPSDLPLNVEIFCIEMDKNLEKAIILQNNTVFQSIKKFCDCLGYYTHYLGCKMDPAGAGCFSIQNTTILYNLDKVRLEINELKKSIDECYESINPNCSMFY